MGERLFETKGSRGRMIYRAFAVTVAASIILIWFYRIKELYWATSSGGRRMVWMGLLAAEVWFGLYWVLTQSVRWNPIYRQTFKDRLSLRHGTGTGTGASGDVIDHISTWWIGSMYENDLPRVDIFVCTADPKIEPPMLVINTVLSVMAYDYPPEKLAVYLSDDGGSHLTFYAMTEASLFSKRWTPYCKTYKIEPRSPAAYFSSVSQPSDQAHAKDFALIKRLYDQMEGRIEAVTKLGRISDEIRLEHEGFAKWDSFTSPRDHDAIIQILIDGGDAEATDADGNAMPTLVYLAREKRPQHFHNFKAGAMNALIRVSSMITNGQIILNVDCDMYSNSSVSVRDALCFFMDEEDGHKIAYVQFPQNFVNMTKNDVYGNALLVISQVDFHGLDGFGGPLYVGTGCFHRRKILLGEKFSKEHRNEWKVENDHRNPCESSQDLEERLKGLASCTFENNTQWGNEMGLKYGCPVEDVITGLSIQSNGWKSVYCNPERKGFLGVAATTLDQALVQHKRWSEGDLQILLSKYSPAWYATGKISPGLQMGYLIYCLWSPNSLPTLFYAIFPSLYLLNGISLFPQVSSSWFLPYAYIIISQIAYTLVEFLLSGGTILGWWNEQRMWLYKRTTSYLFAVTDTITSLTGISDMSFVVSAKVADDDVSERYEKEMMEFGATSSPMFTILTTIAMVNLFCLVGLTLKVMLTGIKVNEIMGVQIVLCGFMVAINLPLFNAVLFRKDKGKMPTYVTLKSVFVAFFVCSCFSFLC